MPTYISMIKYTQKGLEDIKHGPDRVDAVRKAARQAGGDLKAFYLTMGQYDAVSILEAPNDETMARGVLAAAMRGTIHTETFRAFTEDEYKKIVSSLP
jgi:uncharacterized protein with GYD domain